MFLHDKTVKLFNRIVEFMLKNGCAKYVCMKCVFLCLRVKNNKFSTFYKHETEMEPALLT